MARKLILITFDGGPSNFLPGVEKDRCAYLDYFKSQTGGSYTQNEIMEFHNDSMLTATLFDTTISALITHQKVRHLTIVFCGHGYGATNGDTFMKFSPVFDCSVARVATACTGAETLLITDCCRKVQRYVMKMQRISNPSFNVTFATEFDQFAREDSKGGIYTQNLIKAGNIKQLPPPSKDYSIASVHSLASVWMSITKDPQNPQIYGNQIASIIFSHQ